MSCTQSGEGGRKEGEEGEKEASKGEIKGKRGKFPRRMEGGKEGRKIEKYNYGGRTKGEEARQCEQCHFRLFSSFCLSAVPKFEG